MEETWRLGEASVRDIYRAFDERIAYTTVMTTLDRLFKKNLLSAAKMVALSSTSPSSLAMTSTAA